MADVARELGRMWATEFSRSPILVKAREEATVAVLVGLTAPYAQYIDDPLVSAARCSAWTVGAPRPMPPEYASQADVLRAIGKHRRVADKSGQKTGKSSLGAVTALWWMYSRVQGCVTLTAPSSPGRVDPLEGIRLIAQGQHPAQRARGFRPKLPGINGEPGGRLYMNASGGLWLGDGWGIAGSRRTSRSGCRAGAAHSSSTSSMRRPVTPRTSFRPCLAA